MEQPGKRDASRHMNSANQQARYLTGPAASIWGWILDFVFPSRCVGCGRVDWDWCDRCQDNLQQIPLLSLPIPTALPLSGMAATAPHIGPIQRYVQALKYDGMRAVAPGLALRMVRQFEQQDWAIDVVAAVPLHRDRLQQRGYNQAALLSHQVAELLGKPEVSGAIRRNRDTRSQVGLGREARLTNVVGAFQAHPRALRNKRVLLVDDVFTTGATLRACAGALIESGVVAVYGLTATAAQ